MNKVFIIFFIVLSIIVIYWATIDTTEHKAPETQSQGTFIIEDEYSEFIIQIDECSKIITIDMEILILDGWTLNIIKESENQGGKDQ